MIQGLSLVELTVADWSQSVWWYRAHLGMKVIQRDNFRQLALLQDSNGFRLALKGGIPVPGTATLAFEVDNLTAELDRLAKAQVFPIESSMLDDQGHRRAILLDPDGYRIALFDRPAGGPKSVANVQVAG